MHFYFLCQTLYEIQRVVNKKKNHVNTQVLRVSVLIFRTVMRTSFPCDTDSSPFGRSAPLALEAAHSPSQVSPLAVVCNTKGRVVSASTARRSLDQMQSELEPRIKQEWLCDLVLYLRPLLIES